jgi:hypothetical protein
MIRPPLTPNLKFYGGSKESLRRKNAERNAMTERVAEYVNELIAHNPDEIQQYFFGTIASDLDLTVGQVRSAISKGGSNGVTVHVDQDARRELGRYKR